MFVVVFIERQYFITHTNAPTGCGQTEYGMLCGCVQFSANGISLAIMKTPSGCAETACGMFCTSSTSSVH